MLVKLPLFYVSTGIPCFEVEVVIDYLKNAYNLETG